MIAPLGSSVLRYGLQGLCTEKVRCGFRMLEIKNQPNLFYVTQP